MNLVYVLAASFYSIMIFRVFAPLKWLNFPNGHDTTARVSGQVTSNTNTAIQQTLIALIEEPYQERKV